MKILSIVGARPEFIQAIPVSRALRASHKEILVHTGQHYDYKMSQTFFDELGIPDPDYNLEVGSGTHAQQTGEILVRIEQVLLEEKPDLVIVRGDTNSTLSGALAASKLKIPTAHIEAGERSFDRRMPEEINRIVADNLADVYFCVSRNAIKNLALEGISANVHWVGDVMLDVLKESRPLAYRKSNILSQLEITSDSYALVTIHRAANTDDPNRLRKIINILNTVQETIIFPAHPRTYKAIRKLGIAFEDHVRLIEPVGYFDMLVLEDNARLIATDSGGVQREAYFLSTPCITLRDETEWIETVEVGWNKLMGLDKELVIEAWQEFSPPDAHPPIFGDGSAGERIAKILAENRISFGQSLKQKTTVDGIGKIRVSG